MGTKNYKPTSPGRRGMSVSDFSEITRSTPERSLLSGQVKKSGGRNNLGRITSWQRGGGLKRRYRRIDFRRDKIGMPAVVAAIEYDPNRSANIALLHYRDGEKRYIIAPNGLRVGGEVVCSSTAEVRPGNALPLSRIPLPKLTRKIPADWYRSSPADFSSADSAPACSCDTPGQYRISCSRQMPREPGRRNSSSSTPDQL